MAQKTDNLKDYAQQVKFDKAMEYITQSSVSQKKLSSQGLAHINEILNSMPGEDPWRMEPVTLRLKSGRQESFSILSNPVVVARDLISQGRLSISQGNPARGAAELYAGLVKKHLFNDANRRTAVLATLWLLLEFKISVSIESLLKMDIGDVHESGAIDKLEVKIRALSLDL